VWFSNNIFNLRFFGDRQPLLSLFVFPEGLENLRFCAIPLGFFLRQKKVAFWDRTPGQVDRLVVLSTFWKVKEHEKEKLKRYGRHASTM
jgi:hypothetical protein